MARPKKQPYERRSESVRSDLTLAEKRYVQEQAALAGLSEAEYTRRRLLGYAVRAARGAAASDPALVSEFNHLALQLGALGNLANQVALYCHTGRRIPAHWDELPGEISGLLGRVRLQLEELARRGP